MARLLVVDDDAQIVSLLGEYLEDAGHEVAKAGSGTEAMTTFYKSPADVVITDILLPDKDGFEIIHDLRRHDPDVRIIAMSGGGPHSPEYYLPTAGHLGAVLTLQKPFDREDLLLAVAKALAARA